jgi:hypothetical protein
MNAKKSFSVGALRDPRPDDPRFESSIDAESYAREKTAKSDDHTPLGIWHDADGALVSIAYLGLVYWP